ncbi:MAG: molybdate ABC transporter substrate-binding protein [Gammaproteobacteria bacterium]|nr:molybdate ABC transporter substrate-binding protein [Gammaproteobacteria bacterium]
MRTVRKLLFFALFSSNLQAEDLTVYAAASLTEVMQLLSEAWGKAHSTKVRLSFAASSALAKQIEAGAQAGVFLTADARWMEYLDARALLTPNSRIDLLGNTLVLVTPSDNAISLALSEHFDLGALLGDGRLATGDPAHVPVGYYAEAALKSLKVWAIAEPRLVRTDSVRAALVLVERGEVPAGIVYATDAAISTKVRIAGVFPSTSHPPIVYPLARIAANETPVARAFYTYLLSPAARAVFERYGFRQP